MHTFRRSLSSLALLLTLSLLGPMSAAATTGDAAPVEQVDAGDAPTNPVSDLEGAAEAEHRTDAEEPHDGEPDVPDRIVPDGTQATIDLLGPDGMQSPAGADSGIASHEARASDHIDARHTSITMRDPHSEGTSLTSPLLDGTGNPGATVTIAVDGSSVGSTRITGYGYWLFRMPVHMEPGQRTITATQSTDGATAVVQFEAKGGAVAAWSSYPGSGILTGLENVPRDRTYVQVVGTSDRGLALTNLGEVMRWGSAAGTMPPELVGEYVLHLSMDGTNSSRAVALTASGKIIDIGSTAVVAAGGLGEHIVDVDVGFGHANGTSVAVTSSGRALDVRTGEPVPAFSGHPIVRVESSPNTHALIARTAAGHLVVWTADHNAVVRNFPADLKAFNVVQAAVSQGFGVAVLADGSVRFWGTPGHQMIVEGEKLLAGRTIRHISLASNMAYATTSTGRVLQWGDGTVEGTTARDEVLLGARVAQVVLPGIAVVPEAVPNTAPVSVIAPVSGARIAAVPLVRGSGTPGALVSVSVDGEMLGSTTVNERGDWVFRVPAATPLGERTITATQDTDTSTFSSTVTVVGHAIAAWGVEGLADVAGSLEDRRIVQGALSGTQGGFGIVVTDGGDVVTWGGSAGQSDVPEALADERVVQVDAGHDFALALTAEGRVVAWGSDTSGQSTVPAGLDDRRAVMVAAGGRTAYAILDDGSLVVWGEELDDQWILPALFEDDTVVQVDGGGGFAVALTAEGRVRAWGADEAGQTRVPASSQGRAVQVTAGYDSAAALLDDASVVTWGQSSSGQHEVPGEIQGRITSVASGSDFVLALTDDGAVTGWGSDEDGRLDVPAWVSQKVVSQVVAGEKGGFAIFDEITISSPEDGGRTVVSPTLAGRGIPSTQVQVTRLVGDLHIEVGAARTRTDGRWTLDVPGLLALGEHTFVVTSVFGSTSHVTTTVVEAPGATARMTPRAGLAVSLPA